MEAQPERLLDLLPDWGMIPLTSCWPGWKKSAPIKWWQKSVSWTLKLPWNNSSRDQRPGCWPTVGLGKSSTREDPQIRLHPGHQPGDYWWEQLTSSIFRQTSPGEDLAQNIRPPTRCFPPQLGHQRYSIYRFSNALKDWEVGVYNLEKGSSGSSSTGCEIVWLQSIGSPSIPFKNLVHPVEVKDGFTRSTEFICPPPQTWKTPEISPGVSRRFVWQMLPPCTHNYLNNHLLLYEFDDVSQNQQILQWFSYPISYLIREAYGIAAIIVAPTIDQVKLSLYDSSSQYLYGAPLSQASH